MILIRDIPPSDRRAFSAYVDRCREIAHCGASLCLCQVDYDPTLGFPTSLYIDLDAMIADEEDSYTIRDLKITA